MNGIAGSRPSHHYTREEVVHVNVGEGQESVQQLLVEQSLHQVSQVVLLPQRVRVRDQRHVRLLVVAERQMMYEYHRM